MLNFRFMIPYVISSLLISSRPSWALSTASWTTAQRKTYKFFCETTAHAKAKAQKQKHHVMNQVTKQKDDEVEKRNEITRKAWEFIIRVEYGEPHKHNNEETTRDNHIFAWNLTTHDNFMNFYTHALFSSHSTPVSSFRFYSLSLLFCHRRRRGGNVNDIATVPR